MARFVTKKELESILQEINKALFNLDVAVETICEDYCKVDKAEFSENITKRAKARIENAKPLNENNKTTEE